MVMRSTVKPNLLPIHEVTWIIESSGLVTHHLRDWFYLHYPSEFPWTNKPHHATKKRILDLISSDNNIVKIEKTKQYKKNKKK